ncbi:MAG: twin-arginine translocase subunit TatC [Micropruina sp.]|nr:twin-arginine translocase subunit TatC [Micropruina sp.]
MSLGDHLRELRYRVIVSSLAIVAMTIVVAFFYNPVYTFMLSPWVQAVEVLKVTNPNIDTQAVITGVATPLMLAIKICAMGGLVLSSPFWLYQFWAYIVPALLAREKKWALLFLAAAVPLFGSGVAVGYVILPQAISVMMAFTPQSVPVLNLLEINQFLELMLQLMVIFGLGFLMPVVVVGLNLAGVVKATQLAKARIYVIFGTFVFGAAATPSTDPFSMLALAIPMTILFLLAEVICRFNDRRKLRKQRMELAVLP